MLSAASGMPVRPLQLLLQLLHHTLLTEEHKVEEPYKKLLIHQYLYLVSRSVLLWMMVIYTLFGT